jgi:RNA polymerase sigma factor, sigma-70 family
MFSTCMRMCACREDAEDVLQQAFVDVFRKLDHFRGESSVGAWIKRIVINNCINHLKRRRIHWQEVDPLADQWIDEGPEEEHQNGFTVTRIREAVGQLPEGYRAVLNMYLFEGLDHAEIGEFLQISEQTSKSQYSRARKRLREILSQNPTP